MKIEAATPEAYIAALPEDRRAHFKKLRAAIKKNIPKGFQEGMAYGMIGYVVPHRLFPAGYHCNPKLPLLLMSIAVQKNFIAIYHMGIYADPKLLKWFTAAHAKASPQKLDMGKSCIRYKKPAEIPFDLIGELAARMTPEQWIEKYQQALKK